MQNTMIDFRNQQPNQMQQGQPQVVGNQQQRQSLADRLRRYGATNQDSGGQSFANSFDQQMQNSMRMRDPQTSQQQQAGQIMQSYNTPSGGSQTGYQLSAPREAQRGMMGNMARAGNQLQGAASSLGKGAASLGSSAMKAMSAF